MTCPICAWSEESRQYPLVFESTHWRVTLAPNQSLVGRCVVHLKRHAGNLASLTEDEVVDWLSVVRITEEALRSGFGASSLNWSCLMNHAYRESPTNPHVHWWAVPRYRHPVVVNGVTFEDPHFGSPYDHHRWQEVSKDVHEAIANTIRGAMQSASPGTGRQP